MKTLLVRVHASCFSQHSFKDYAQVVFLINAHATLASTGHTNILSEYEDCMKSVSVNDVLTC